MPSESPYRTALAIVMLLTMAITVYHRLQAAKSGEKISRRDEGYLFAVVLRLAGLCLWIATFGYLFFPTYFQWAAMPLPVWVRWIGVGVGILCSLLMYWTLSSLPRWQVVRRREPRQVQRSEGQGRFMGVRLRCRHAQGNLPP